MKYLISFLIFTAAGLLLTEQKTTEEQLAENTIKINVEKNGKHYSGTGFFIGLRKNGKLKVVIVTNRHVVENSTKTTLSFNKKEGEKVKYGDRVNYKIRPKDIPWIHHPDSTIDLSIMEIDKILLDTRIKGKSIATTYIPESYLINTEEWNSLTMLNEVVMIGYPNGLSDVTNNLPIARGGFTATHPKLNYNNKPEFLTDITTFGGSSGSPVFLKNTKLRRLGKTGITNSPDYRLIGIHYGGSYYNQKLKKAEKISLDTIDNKIIDEFKFPIGLGYVVKSDKLLDFKDLIFP